MQQEKIKPINPRECKNWQFSDRLGTEYGDIYKLGSDIKDNGQVEPVIARNCKNKKNKYEIITGSRRWKACLELEIPLLARILELSDEEAALYQMKENDKYPISDFSKGMHFDKLLESNITTIEKIAQTQNCDKQKVYNFLAFSKIPPQVSNAIQDMSKVSARSAKTIYTLANKGQKYIDTLIEIAADIQKGAGAKKIEALVTQRISKENKTLDDNKNLIDSKGNIIGWWKKNTIVFDKNIDQEKIGSAIAKALENY